MQMLGIVEVDNQELPTMVNPNISNDKYCDYSNDDSDHISPKVESLPLECKNAITDDIDSNSRYLDTTELYKIWFNKNPDSLLNEKNKFRLAEFRANNPCAKISLVYSAELLSPVAKDEAANLFRDYNIVGINFDDVFISAVNSKELPEIELKMLSLAKEELNNFGNRGNGGGNPAAAADILRFSRLIFETYGIYSDFDVALKFDYTKPLVKIQAPMIIPSDNNDFVAFARKGNNQDLDPSALKLLKEIQLKILDKYNSFKPHYSVFTSKAYEKIKEDNKIWSLQEWRSQIEKFDVYDLLELTYKDNDVFFNNPSVIKNLFINEEKLELNLHLLKSSRSLSKSDAIKLFCNIHKQTKLFALDEIEWDSIHNEIFETLGNDLSFYGIENDDFKNKVLLFNSLSVEDGNILLHKIFTEAIRLPENIIKENYYNLIIKSYLDAIKYSLYKKSVMNFSGPEILFREQRDFYSPEQNGIENYIERKDGQDASWQFEAIMK